MEEEEEERELEGCQASELMGGLECYVQCLSTGAIDNNSKIDP